MHELPTYIALTYITLTIGVVLLHMLLAYDTLYYRLVSIPAYNLFSVSNSVFNCCLRQWWQDGCQINRRNTTHFRRSDSSTESREAASHLQICRVCQVSVDFWYRRLTHSLPIMPTGTLGSNKGPPQLSVPSQPLGVAPAVAQAHHLCLYSASPFILGSAPLPPALWCPVECSLRKKVSLPPGNMTYPDDITYPSLTDNKRVKPCMHLGTNKVSRVIHRADFRYLKVLFQNQVFYLGIVWLAKHNMKYKCATARLREHQLAASVGQQ